MILHGIPNCDTVKRARAWLTERGVAHEFHDFKRQGVPAQALERWIDTLGHEHLVNRQGTTWRKLDDVTKADAGEAAGARALMLAQPSVIRRPVVQWPDGAITAGFDADEWAKRLG
jgi:Spx/MgsR family transcriptional regulator